MARRNSAQKQIGTIRRSIRAIERALTRLAPAFRQATKVRAQTRRLTLSPKRRAALKLHGRYLGFVRQLKPAQKAKVKAAQASKGYHAAIRLAKRLLSK